MAANGTAAISRHVLSLCVRVAKSYDRVSIIMGVSLVFYELYWILESQGAGGRSSGKEVWMYA